MPKWNRHKSIIYSEHRHIVSVESQERALVNYVPNSFRPPINVRCTFFFFISLLNNSGHCSKHLPDWKGHPRTNVDLKRYNWRTHTHNHYGCLPVIAHRFLSIQLHDTKIDISFSIHFIHSLWMSNQRTIESRFVLCSSLRFDRIRSCNRNVLRGCVRCAYSIGN